MHKRDATVAVVGAGDYIGAEIVKKFASEGFTVFAGRRDGAKLEPLVRDVEAAGGSIVARSLDARKEVEVAAFLNDADAHADPISITQQRARPSTDVQAPTTLRGCSKHAP